MGPSQAPRGPGASTVMSAYDVPEGQLDGAVLPPRSGVHPAQLTDALVAWLHPLAGDQKFRVSNPGPAWPDWKWRVKRTAGF